MQASSIWLSNLCFTAGLSRFTPESKRRPIGNRSFSSPPVLYSNSSVVAATLSATAGLNWCTKVTGAWLIESRVRVRRRDWASGLRAWRGGSCTAEAAIGMLGRHLEKAACPLAFPNYTDGIPTSAQLVHVQLRLNG